MKQPTAVQRAQTVDRIREALGLLAKPISDDEIAEAAEALHIEHMLPERQDELLPA